MPVTDYMYGLMRFGIKPGLEVISGLLAQLGDPQNKMLTVHITGTNGKGSTCAYLATILQQAGHNVGLYTSPHLMRFNERIRVNDKDIDDADLEKLAAAVKEASDKAGLEPTFFEFTTAVAFLHFYQKKVDIAVIEVGMGGRLDGTNVINPLVSVITNIGWDHMTHLGDTLEKIAYEKAGIIKKDSIVVTAETRPELLRLFSDTCKERGATLLHVDDLISAKLLTHDLKHQLFSVKGIMNCDIDVVMLGEHQVRNALTALVAAKQLQANGVKLSDDDITEGLALTHWAGRIDIINRKPLVIMDGAHNLPGMETLAAFAKELPRRKILVIAMKEDKDAIGMMSLILPLFETVIITEGNFKPTPAEILAKKAAQFSKNVITLADVNDALEKAFSLAGADGTIMITGSLYMVGDAMLCLKAKKLLPLPEAN